MGESMTSDDSGALKARTSRIPYGWKKDITPKKVQTWQTLPIAKASAQQQAEQPAGKHAK